MNSSDKKICVVCVTESYCKIFRHEFFRIITQFSFQARCAQRTPESTRVISGAMNMGYDIYVYDTAPGIELTIWFIGADFPMDIG